MPQHSSKYHPAKYLAAAQGSCCGGGSDEASRYLRTSSTQRNRQWSREQPPTSTFGSFLLQAPWLNVFFPLPPPPPTQCKACILIATSSSPLSRSRLRLSSIRATQLRRQFLAKGAILGPGTPTFRTRASGVQILCACVRVPPLPLPVSRRSREVLVRFFSQHHLVIQATGSSFSFFSCHFPSCTPFFLLFLFFVHLLSAYCIVIALGSLLSGTTTSSWPLFFYPLTDWLFPLETQASTSIHLLSVHRIHTRREAFPSPRK